MFTLIHGNRQELLARLLAERLKADPPGLFDTEAVVVQSGAMERWLKLFLAEELGIAAQLRFPFPAGYLWELFSAVLPDVPASSPFAGGLMHWRLLRLLGQARDGEAFAPLRHYLAGGDVSQRDGLARRLSATFEDYLAYRPDWLAAWSEGRHLGLGPHEIWQASLWREIRDELPHLPQAHPREAFFAALAATPALVDRLPRRISLFGIGNLPPPYFEVFRALGRYREVSLYLLNPCRLHWGDVVARRTAARARLAEGGDGAGLDLETGNGLLGSLGTLARQCFDLATQGADGEVDVFAAAEGNHLLGWLQNDLLDLVDRRAAARLPLEAGDDSVQIHVCHGPMREVEVLRDRLLDLFARQPDLRPGDVLVLTPDIDRYAPLIEAVFAAPGGVHLPFTVADRSPATAILPRAFADFLALAEQRFEAERVLDFLAQPPVARRFGFDDARLERIRDWVREAAIRWGVDGPWRTRQDASLPAVEDHGWRWGLERLLLGMALPDDAEPTAPLFQGMAPAGHLAGSEAADLGRFIDFVEALVEAHDVLNQPRPVAAWAEILARYLDLFFALDHDPESELAARQLLTALQRMTDEVAAVACIEAVPLPVVRETLADALAVQAPGWTFLGGGITFGALRPYRAVPVRVLCLLGLDDGVFPRNPARPGFDLLARHPRPGDRAPRDEDRHAFLEALLSARDWLHLSYGGRSVRDNAELPPSSLLGELGDTLDRGFVAPDGGPVLPSITVAHPLQAFSRRYFEGSALFSYAEDYAAASRAACEARAPARPFLADALPPPTEAPALTPESLTAFLVNPARFLLRQRLGIHLELSEGLIEAAEPFLLSGLDAYNADAAILACRLAGDMEPEAVRARLWARGLLPHGVAGEAQFRARWQGLDPLVRRIRASGLSAEVTPLTLALPIGDEIMGGQLAGVGPEGVLLWRTGKLRAKDRLQLWVRHLLLHCVAPAEIPRYSRFLTPEDEWILGPVADAETHLAGLVALWWRGQQSLLPFFPETALAWVQGKGEWRSQWESDFEQARPEADEPYFQVAFAGTDPVGANALGDEFRALAQAVFGPLLAAAKTS